MKFYLMWANHDVWGYQWNHNIYKPDTIMWQGDVEWNNFRLLVERVIKQYFKQPGYFRQEVEKAGFEGLHFQLSGYNHGKDGQPHLLPDALTAGKTINETVSLLGINSITTYNWGGGTDYITIGERSILWRNNWDSLRTIPYFPNVAIGYDDSPRFSERGKGVVYINNSPESFAAYLQKAKEYSDNHPEQPKLITINSWNEWTEGSYLEPDMKWGYSYLEAVKKVMSGIYDPYSGN